MSMPEDSDIPPQTLLEVATSDSLDQVARLYREREFRNNGKEAEIYTNYVEPIFQYFGWNLALDYGREENIDRPSGMKIRPDSTIFLDSDPVIEAEIKHDGDDIEAARESQLKGALEHVDGNPYIGVLFWKDGLEVWIYTSIDGEIVYERVVRTTYENLHQEETLPKYLDKKNHMNGIAKERVRSQALAKLALEGDNPLDVDVELDSFPPDNIEDTGVSSSSAETPNEDSGGEGGRTSESHVPMSEIPDGELPRNFIDVPKWVENMEPEELTPELLFQRFLVEGQIELNDIRDESCSRDWGAIALGTKHDQMVDALRFAFDNGIAGEEHAVFKPRSKSPVISTEEHLDFDPADDHCWKFVTEVNGCRVWVKCQPLGYYLDSLKQFAEEVAPVDGPDVRISEDRVVDDQEEVSIQQSESRQAAGD